MRRSVLVVAVLALVGIGVAFVVTRDGGGVDHPDAAEALERQMGYLRKGQWLREWAELHPAQQAEVSSDHFAVCAQDSVEVQYDDIDVIETYEEQIRVPPLRDPVDSVAITFRVRDGQQTDEGTLHEVEVDGEWKWVLSSTEDYQDGNCPS